jgi:hypothetical protein
VIRLIGLLLAATAVGIAVSPLAHAETPLEAFCADNAIRLKQSTGESGTDPASWAMDPANLARFGYRGLEGIAPLYQAIVGAGAPSIRSFWSNLNGRVEWRCEGQK